MSGGRTTGTAVTAVLEGVKRRFAAALLPRLFRNNVPGHTTKAPPVGVRAGDQQYPVLCHCQLGQDIPAQQSDSEPGTTDGFLV